MKAFFTGLLMLGVVYQANSQSSAHHPPETLDDFAALFFESLVKKDPTLIFPLLYTRTGLMETVKAKVRNEELKAQMLEDIDVASFDQNVFTECRDRHARLIGNPDIQWDKIKFENFEFNRDTLQSEKYAIETGQGFLYFSYDGVHYKIMVDKMARLLSGWRGHEFGSSYLKTNSKSQITNRK